MVQTVGNIDRTLVSRCCTKSGLLMRGSWPNSVNWVILPPNCSYSCTASSHEGSIKTGLSVQCGCSFSSSDLVSLGLNLYSYKVCNFISLWTQPFLADATHGCLLHMHESAWPLASTSAWILAYSSQKT